MDATNDSEHFAKLSAGLWMNSKWNRLCRLDPGAAILWINSLSFSAMTLNDGHEEAEVVGKLGGSDLQVQHITSVGMGVSDGKGGYTIHDYEKYQLTKAEALKLHAKRSMAGKKGMKSRWHGINPRYIDTATGEEIQPDESEAKNDDEKH